MIKRIKRINPLQLGKMAAVMYGVMSVLFTVFLFLSELITGRWAWPGSLFLFFLPVMYVVFGFVFCVIGAFIYNLCAKWLGGVEIELED